MFCMVILRVIISIFIVAALAACQHENLHSEDFNTVFNRV